MREANLIHVDADGAATLVNRGDPVALKKQFNEHPLKKGESLELLGYDLEPKRRGGTQDRDKYFATVARENADMRATEKARSKKPAPLDPKAHSAAVKKADEGKSAETLAIKAAAAKRQAAREGLAAKTEKPAKNKSEKSSAPPAENLELTNPETTPAA